jgi:hypothetical protein
LWPEDLIEQEEDFSLNLEPLTFTFDL